MKMFHVLTEKKRCVHVELLKPLILIILKWMGFSKQFIKCNALMMEMANDSLGNKIFQN